MSAELRMKLRVAVAELDEGLEQVRAELQRQIDAGDFVAGTTPWTVRDGAGRFLLLDATAARAEAVAALATLSR